MQKGNFTSNMIITCGMKSNQQYNFFEVKFLKMTAFDHGHHYLDASYISFKFTVSNDIGKKDVNKKHKSKNVI